MKDEPPRIEVSTLLIRRISLFAHWWKDRPREEITFADLFNAVKTGRWEAATAQIRKANATDKNQADKLKKNLLPVVKPSGRFKGLKAGDLLEHSGVLCIDFDNLGEQLDIAKERFRNDPFAFAYAISPRGTGLKVFVPVAATNEAEHHACFDAAQRHFSKYAFATGALDTAPRNIAANCFCLSDPELWVASGVCEVFQPSEESLKEGGEKEIISKDSVDSKGSIGSMSQGNRRAKRRQAEDKLRGLPKAVQEAYRRCLANRSVQRGNRHAFLIKAIPALFEWLSTNTLLNLLLLHYDMHDGIWTTPRNDHEAEIRQMLLDWESRYIEALKQPEREAYTRIDESDDHAAFRICRYFAKKNGSFHMSYNQLGERIGKHREEARRIMLGLLGDNVLEIVEVGEAWADGKKPKATTWKWLL
ncbi:MAG TPA: BT4734/BF3469 family protein [Opitutaceae bacterium]|nr:BT4734/BF3469 family protein [Opitutaceae bacterium]